MQPENNNKIKPINRGFRSSWQSRRRWSSPPPTNTLKIHLHVEDFSLKTNQRLAKRLLGHQGYKKDPYVTGKERKRSCQVRTCAPGRGVERKRTHSLGGALSELHWTPQLWGPRQGRPAHWPDWRNSETNKRLWEGWTPLARSARMLALPPKHLSCQQLG